ncbi:MAG: hypothetical protein A3I02_17025 [Betaproteobacteria bacterium RIFCSPLOWO2_02_FULL_67_26]|nr:MAG: hypothetical protein A3I02_17025 [Betaproteobacteria bacterium RIFCSPLOWO2_02_FULL_67_26]
MFLGSGGLTVRQPGFLDRVASRVVFHDSYAKRRFMPQLTARQHALIDQLRSDGCIVLERYLPARLLSRLQQDLDAALRALKFEMPSLAQTRVDPVRHAALIDNFLYGSPQQLKAQGAAFDRDEARDYEQVLRDFNPSTLSVQPFGYSPAFREAWLDPFLLGIVSGCMGMVPKLSEAYVRRNFPAPHRTMNHFWHRDLNTPFHLLKIFFFLTDCARDTGPHEFINESHRRLDVLNGQRYFTDPEVDRAYPAGDPRRVVSEVRAGTVIIEDTRGLHRAQLPQTGYRDLGYAVFVPLRPFYPHRNYEFPRAAYRQFSAFQQAFIPDAMLV